MGGKVGSTETVVAYVCQICCGCKETPSEIHNQVVFLGFWT